MTIGGQKLFLSLRGRRARLGRDKVIVTGNNKDPARQDRENRPMGEDARKQRPAAEATHGGRKNLISENLRKKNLRGRAWKPSGHDLLKSRRSVGETDAGGRNYMEGKHKRH